MPLERRRLSRADLEAVSLRHRTWGVWGDDDELGAANSATPERVAAAAQEIRRGTVFSLALPMDDTGPMKGVNGRVNPQHLMLRTGADLLADPQENGNIHTSARCGTWKLSPRMVPWTVGTRSFCPRHR